MGRDEGARKTISMEEWEKKMREVHVSKEELNKLVMNYLYTEGYATAARTFSEESGAKLVETDDCVDERMTIRSDVQSGNIASAISRVNDLNPEILEEGEGVFFHLQQQRLIEYIREGKVEEALAFAHEYLAPRGEENEALLEELERTITLLAFEKAETSPLGELMEESQRQKTASELNSAILSNMSMQSQAKLPVLLKTMVWAQSQLADKCKFPQMNNLVTAKLELSSGTTTNGAEAGGGGEGPSQPGPSSRRPSAGLPSGMAVE